MQSEINETTSHLSVENKFNRLSVTYFRFLARMNMNWHGSFRTWKISHFK